MENKKAQYTCRHHPTDSFHEVGCEHQEWSKENLQGALNTAKLVNEAYVRLLMEHPELVLELDLKVI